MSFTNFGETLKCRAFAIAIGLEPMAHRWRLLGPVARRWLTPMAVAFLVKRHDPHPQLDWMCLARHRPPYLPRRRAITKESWTES